ncbi:hypothetical protein ACCO45_004962 [Purpureocillium lilacinum]|uniref:Uncharacterized protein n=1 Tax=Purpureocillium lilacinum TaxID=33203 RepID=A0ACC4DU22_PURLI
MLASSRGFHVVEGEGRDLAGLANVSRRARPSHRNRGNAMCRAHNGVAFSLGDFQHVCFFLDDKHGLFLVGPAAAGPVVCVVCPTVVEKSVSSALRVVDAPPPRDEEHLHSSQSGRVTQCSLPERQRLTSAPWATNARCHRPASGRPQTHNVGQAAFEHLVRCRLDRLIISDAGALSLPMLLATLRGTTGLIPTATFSAAVAQDMLANTYQHNWASIS